MEQDLETRVGYVTVNSLKNIVESYIRDNVKDYKYQGELHYLALYDQYEAYLKK